MTGEEVRLRYRLGGRYDNKNGKAEIPHQVRDDRVKKSLG